jgi:hypothetical protein
MAVPMLVIGTLVFAFVVWSASLLWLRPAAAPAFDPTAAHAEWQQQVREQVSRLTSKSTSENVAAVLQNILSLRVVAQDRDAHLALVLALTAFEHGSPHAFEKVQAAYQQTQP